MHVDARALRVISLAIMRAASPLLAQTATGVKPASDFLASMQSPAFTSHGSMLLGVFYLAAGAGPHPRRSSFTRTRITAIRAKERNQPTRSCTDQCHSARVEDLRARPDEAASRVDDWPFGLEAESMP